MLVRFDAEEEKSENLSAMWAGEGKLDRSNCWLSCDSFITADSSASFVIFAFGTCSSSISHNRSDEGNGETRFKSFMASLFEEGFSSRSRMHDGDREFESFEAGEGALMM